MNKATHVFTLFPVPALVLPQNAVYVLFDNVVFFDLFFQPTIISVKGFLLRLEFPVFFLHGGKIGEL